MPIASIQILKGRSSEDRKLLISRVTDAIVATLEVQPVQVRVIVTEIEPENWGVAGVTKAEPPLARSLPPAVVAGSKRAQARHSA